MRLVTMQRLIREALETLRTVSGISGIMRSDGQSGEQLEGITGHPLRNALNKLARVGGLRDKAVYLLRLESVRDAGDDKFPQATVKSKEIHTLKSAIHELQGVAKVLADTLQDIAPDLQQDVLLVTAPDDIADLASFRAFIGDLESGIAHPLQMATGENLVLGGVDRGSIVIELMVGVAATTGLFIKLLLDAVERAEAKRLAVEGAQAVMAEVAELNQEVRETAKAGLREYRRSLANEIAAKFEAQRPDANNENETQQRILHGIEVLVALHDRGTQLQLVQYNRKVADETASTVKLLAAVPKLLGDGGTEGE